MWSSCSWTPVSLLVSNSLVLKPGHHPLHCWSCFLDDSSGLDSIRVLRMVAHKPGHRGWYRARVVVVPPYRAWSTGGCTSRSREACTRSWVHHGPPLLPLMSAHRSRSCREDSLGSSLLTSLGEVVREDSSARGGHRSSEVLLGYYARAKTRTGERSGVARVSWPLINLEVNLGRRSRKLRDS